MHKFLRTKWGIYLINVSKYIFDYDNYSRKIFKWLLSTRSINKFRYNLACCEFLFVMIEIILGSLWLIIVSFNNEYFITSIFAFSLFFIILQFYFNMADIPINKYPHRKMYIDILKGVNIFMSSYFLSQDIIESYISELPLHKLILNEHPIINFIFTYSDIIEITSYIALFFLMLYVVNKVYPNLKKNDIPSYIPPKETSLQYRFLCLLRINIVIFPFFVYKFLSYICMNYL